MRIAALIVVSLVLGLFVFLQHEEIVALRGQRDRALQTCEADE